MKLLVDATMLDGRPSGAATRLLALGTAFAARADVELVHLVRPGLDPLPGLATRPVDGMTTPWSRARAGRRLDALARAERADLLCAGALPLPRLRAVPLVATVHDLRFLDPRAEPSLARRAWGRACLARNLRRASRVVAVSRATADALHRDGGVESSRLAVVPNAPSPALLPVADVDVIARFRRRAGLNARYVLVVGSFAPHKNVAWLGPVMARVRALPGCGDLGLVVAGRAEPALALRAAARWERLGLADAARFVGELRDEELAAAYAGAEALLVPSLVEGFSIPAVDAQRLGVPVVATRLPALEEVCGQGAWLVPRDDLEGFAAAVAAAVTEGPERRARIEAGRAAAARWSWTRSAAALAEVCTDVVLSAGKGPGS